MRNISIICIFIALIISSRVGYCASNNSSELYQETIWVSQDVTEEQQAAIDKIIQSKSPEINKIFEQAALFEAAIKNTSDEQSENLLNFLKVMQQLDEVRSDIDSEIMGCLTTDQQLNFENLLDSRLNRVANMVGIMTVLNLEDKQQIKLINSLMLCQLEAWKIVSNPKLSWEQRRMQLQGLNSLQLISNLLNKDQKGIYQAYLAANMGEVN